MPKNRQSKRGHTASPGEPWLFGIHAVRAALENPLRRCHRLMLTKSAVSELQSSIALRKMSHQVADSQAFEEFLPQGSVHQGAALLADPLPEPDIEDLIDRAKATDSPLILLDQISDPHNVGAILRSAAVFGACGLVMLTHHAPPLTGVLAKAASGAVEHVPIARVTNLSQTLGLLAKEAILTLGLDEKGEQALSELRHDGPVALVLGAEGAGLRHLTREKCDLLMRLPNRGPISSLNVSNAAAVALYEITQRSVGTGR